MVDFTYQQKLIIENYTENKGIRTTMVTIKLTDKEAAYLVKLLEWRQRVLEDAKKPYERVRFGLLDMGPESAEIKKRRADDLARLLLVESMLPKVKSATKK